ncbi:MAG TPA: hypothetical protein VGL93_25935, partial [Streptosporangiaceae bacterium]
MQPVDPTLAEWWQRLVARIIDGAGVYIAAYIIYFVISIPLSLMLTSTASGSSGEVGGAAVVYII